MRKQRIQIVRPASCSGFTLVELLVVIGIIIALVGMLMPAILKARRQGRITECHNNLRQVAMALKIYTGNFKGYLPSWAAGGQLTATLRFKGQYVTSFGGHYGPSRHMVIAQSPEVTDVNTLTAGKLNFVTVGIGMLMSRGALSAGVLCCPAMKGDVSTWYGSNEYKYFDDFDKLTGQGDLRLRSGNRLYPVPVTGTTYTVALLSGYSYRNTPFYSRKKPDNADATWSYTSDYPSLADYSTPGQPWVAEWDMDMKGYNTRARFMTPIFRTERQLNNRSIASDTFDFADPPTTHTFGRGGLGNRHHGRGYNIMYGDGHVEYYDDDENSIAEWEDWADPSNPGTDNLTISSFSSHKIWAFFDRLALPE